MQEHTTTTLSFSSGSPVFGGPLTFTATVNPVDSGVPAPNEGTATFKDGGTSLGTAGVSGGLATFTLSNLAAGTHASLTASYGSSDYGASNSDPKSLSVAQASTSTTVSASANPSVLNRTVTFTATVTPQFAGCIPTGTVTFKDGTTSIGTGVLNGAVTDLATFTTNSLSVATHTITAVYGTTDANFTASTSGNSIVQTINAATLTWTGNGTDNGWATPGNWVGPNSSETQVTPQNGDELIFAGTNKQSNVDNVPNLSVASITFNSGGFTIQGNGTVTSITDTGNGTNAGSGNALVSNNTTGTNTIGLNLTFSTTVPTISQAANGTLSLTGNVANGGLLLTAAGAGSISMSGVVSGTGGLTNNGTGTLTLTNTNNSYGGNTTVNAGTLKELINGAAGTGTITVNNTGTLTLNGTYTYANAINLFNGSTLRGTGGNVTVSGVVTIGSAANTTVNIQTGTTLGTDLLQLDGNNKFQGGVSTATVTVGDSGTSGKFFIGIAANTTGGTQGYTGNWVVNGTLGGCSPSGTSTPWGPNTNLITINGGGTLELAKDTAGTLAYPITVAGSGTATLNVHGRTGGQTAGQTLGTLSIGNQTLAIINSRDNTDQVVLTSVTCTDASIFNNTRNLTMASLAETNPAAKTVSFNGAGNVTISGTVTQGTGNLAVTLGGTGTVTFNGAASYTGPTTINSGTLTAGAVNVLSANSAVTVNSPGILNTASLTNTIGSLAGTGNVTLGTANLTTVGNDGTNTSFSGVISGAGGGLTKIGAGTLTLSGNSTYSGNTTISGGTLNVAAPTGGLGNGTGTVTFSGGTLQVSANATIANPMSVTNATGLFNINANTTLTASGAITGNQGLTMTTGAGTLLLTTTAKAYTGNTTVGAGTLKDGIANAVPATSPLILGSGGSSGIFDLGGFNQASSANITTSGTGTSNAVTNSSGTAAVLTANTTGTATWSAPITGNLSLATGTGTLILSGPNTYSGNTTLSGGVLQIGSSTQIAANAISSGPLGKGTLVISAASTLQTGSSPQTIANPVSITNSFTETFSGASGGGLTFDPTGVTSPAVPQWGLAGNTLTIVANTVTTTITHVVTGTGLLTFNSGTGTIALGGQNTYSGQTVISTGAVIQVNTSSTGTTSGPFGSYFGDAWTLNGVSFTLLSDGSPRTLNYAATLVGTSTFTLGGAGGIILSGNLVNNGTTTFTVNNNSTISGQLARGGGIIISSTSTGTLTLDNTSNNASGFPETINGGTLRIATVTDLGTGALTFGGGTLAVTGNTTITQAVTLNTGGGTINLPGTSATLSGNITGTGNLTKTGTGTLVLSYANGYSGGTTVSGGTLLVTNTTGSGTGAGNVTVNTGGTLGGGTATGGGGISGNITVNSGGTLDPGTSSTSNGILTVGGNVTMSSGSTFAAQLSGNTAGTGYDQLSVTGTITLNNPALAIGSPLGFNPTTVPANSFTLITSSNSFAGNGTFNNQPASLTMTLQGADGKTRDYQITYPANSAVITQITEQTTTTVISPVNASVFGQPVTFTATVSSTFTYATPPTGTVTFSDGTTSLGTATVNTSGNVTYSARRRCTTRWQRIRSRPATAATPTSRSAAVTCCKRSTWRARARRYRHRPMCRRSVRA